MLADSHYVRVPHLRRVEQRIGKKPTRYSLGNLHRTQAPIHHSYTSYAPVVASDAAVASVGTTFIGSILGKTIIVVTIAAVVIGIVVGTAVPLSKPKSLTDNSESGPYDITYNVSNINLTVGNITDSERLNYLQKKLDDITTTYSSVLSFCRLHLVYAEVKSSDSITVSTTLQCNVFCPGTCAQQKATALTSIIANNANTYVINDFPEISNKSLRLARSVLPLEQTEKSNPGNIIDGRKVVGVNGIVVSVSIYVDQSCNGHTIEFGAFEMNYHEGENAEFTVTASSGSLIINKNELSDDKTKLITIHLCSNNNEDILDDPNCQGLQFPIKSQEYFGSFSSHCSLGSITLEKIDDAYTYINQNDENAFKKPFTRLHYTSLGKQDVLQVPTIISPESNNKKERNQRTTIRSVPRVLFLGTYPPRGCGLATFLHDVIINYDQQFHTESPVIAIDEPGTSIDRIYPNRVIARLNQTERESHLNIGKFINQLNHIDIINIQHEFGLFGGQAGEWILHLISIINKPVIVTFHTVLQDPASIYYSITRAICSSATGIIVLSYSGRDILIKTYQIDIEKIHVVPHGIPDVSFLETLHSKYQFNFNNHITMATFGLIGRSKGLEYAIRSIKLAVKQVPNLLYIILGATHPVILKEVGEEYRNELQIMIKNLNLTNNIKLINKYLDNKELLNYLSAVDIYLTPYPNPDQVVSGTLSIALGCGKAMISTPYIYAKELLAHGRGFLVPFKNDTILSETIVRIATDTEMRDIARRRAYKYGRKMIWSRVVIELARIYENALLDM